MCLQCVSANLVKCTIWLSIILEFFSFNSYVLDFGLEGGVLGLGLGLGLGSWVLGLGLGLGSCGLGLGLEVCVLGLALALGVMSLLTSLIVTGSKSSRHTFPSVCTIGLRENVSCRLSSAYWKFYIFALAPPGSETSWIFHDSSVLYPHIYRFANEIVDIRFI